MSDVYYKITRGNTKTFKVVCMQWFDELDYDETKFINDEWGYHRKFYSESEAIKWLNENVKEEYIDERDKVYDLSPSDYLK